MTKIDHDTGWWNIANLPQINCPWELEPILLEREFGMGSYEQTKRINGGCQCPKCGLWWPCVEEPDMWDWDEDFGQWIATGWWGAAVCEECNILMVDQPDGESECYQLDDDA